jgi:hypothetical protein
MLLAQYFNQNEGPKMRSTTLAAAITISSALGMAYAPIAAFIAHAITHLAQIVAGT